MLTGTFVRCGAFPGILNKSHSRNRRGLYENIPVRATVFRHALGEYSDTSRTLSSLKSLYEMSKNTDKFTQKYILELTSAVLGAQGYDGGTAIYKHSRYAFLYRSILDQMENCTIVIPERATDEIVDSHYKGYPNRRITEEDLRASIDVYRTLFDDIEKYGKDRVKRIDTLEMVKGNYSEIRPLVQSIPNLTWDEEKVDKWIIRKSRRDNDEIFIKNRTKRPSN